MTDKMPAKIRKFMLIALPRISFEDRLYIVITFSVPIIALKKLEGPS